MSNIQLTEEQKASRDIILDILALKNVKTFTVTFDGSGDSGQIEDISLEDNLLESNVAGASVNKGTIWTDEGSVENIDTNPTMREVIEELCYAILEGVCGGWEINEGSYGEFVFDVKKRKVRLDFNERVESVNSSEYSF